MSGLTAALQASSTLASAGATGVAAAVESSCPGGADPPTVTASMDAILKSIQADLAQQEFPYYENILCKNKHGETIKAALGAVAKNLAKLMN